MKIDAIVVGDRVRKDMGDITALAESIRQRGLLHPVVVLSDGTLVAGFRRLMAVRQLGWSEVPVTTVDVDDLLAAERDENEERKNFTPTEAVALGRLIEERESPAAMERAREGWRRGAALTNTGGQAPEEKVDSGGHPQVADVVAPAVGMSRPTYLRAKEVVHAAEQNPEKYGDLPDRMDKTGNITGAVRELRQRQIKTGDVPKNGNRGTKVADERRARVKEMAAKGYTRAQMAAEVGVGTERIGTYCKELGIDVPADVMGRPRSIDSNRVVRETVAALEGLVIGIRLVEVDELDSSEVEHWANSLSDSLRSLNRLAKQLKEMTRVST